MRAKSYTHLSRDGFIHLNNISFLPSIEWQDSYTRICLIDEYNKMTPDYKEAIDKFMLVNDFSMHNNMLRMKINAKIEIAKSLMSFNNIILY